MVAEAWSEGRRAESLGRRAESGGRRAESGDQSVERGRAGLWERERDAAFPPGGIFNLNLELKPAAERLSRPDHHSPDGLLPSPVLPRAVSVFGDPHHCDRRKRCEQQRQHALPVE